MEKNVIIGVSELYFTYCKFHLKYMYISFLKYNRLCGFPPFYDDDNFELFEKIKKGSFDFPSPSWDNITPDAIEIVKSLLKVNPEERMTPDELLKHPWVNGKTTLKKGGDVLKKMREWKNS